MAALPPLYRVMYLSRARRPLSAGELEDLLAGARLRNERSGISGLLLYDAGYFAQVLEGPTEAVAALMSRIEDDPRHEDIAVLSAGPIDERYFEGWGMDWAHVERMDDSKHAELRRYMRSHHVAERDTVYRALVLFVQEHADRRRVADGGEATA